MKIEIHSSCEVEYFVETHLCKLCYLLDLCWTSAADARPVNCKSNVVPLATTRTNGPWTHTSDDSYIYQLSLLLATAVVSFLVHHLGPQKKLSVTIV